MMMIVDLSNVEKPFEVVGERVENWDRIGVGVQVKCQAKKFLI